MKRVVCSTFAVLLLVTSYSHARSYEIDIQRYDQPFLNRSTYDITVRDTTFGFGDINIPDSAWKTGPSGGAVVSQMIREAPYHRRANAQADLYDAQAALLRLQYANELAKIEQRTRESKARTKAIKELTAELKRYVAEENARKEKQACTPALTVSKTSQAAKARLFARVGVNYVPPPAGSLSFGEKMARLKASQKAKSKQPRTPLYTYRKVNGEVKRVFWKWKE